MCLCFLLCARRHSKGTVNVTAQLLGEGFYCDWEREHIQRHLDKSRTERKRNRSVMVRTTDVTDVGEVVEILR